MDSVKYELNTNSNPLLGENELENHEINQIMTNFDIFKLSLNLGIFSFGDRLEQIELFREKLVREKKYLKLKEFEYLYSLCKIFPGHTPTQLLFTIAICKSKSLLGGFISLLSFISPSLFVMLLVSLIAKNIRDYSLSETKPIWDPEDDFFLYYMSILGAGVCQGAVSLVIFNAITLTKSIAKQGFDYSIIFGCGILFYFLDSNFILIFLIMMLGGVASCFQGDHDYFLDVSMSSLKLGNIQFLGIPALLTMIAIYLVIFVTNFFYKGMNNLIYLCESFYRIGTFNFGGGHAVIPLMLGEYSKIIEEKEILIGYAISSLLPGPLFNISAFIGSLLYGLIGGIASLLSIMLPGIFFIMTILPYHTELTKNNLVQHFLRGASWATIGFLYVAGLRLWIDSCLINKYTNYLTGSFNIMICLGLLETKLVNSKILFVLSFGALFSLFCKLIEINFL
jgi:chromate transporter